MKIKRREIYKLDGSNFYAFFIRKKENLLLWITETNRYETRVVYNNEGKCLFYKNYAENVFIPSLNKDTNFNIKEYINYDHI